MACPVHDISDLTGLSSLKAEGDAERRIAKRAPYIGPQKRKALRLRQRLTQVAVEAIQGTTLPRFAPNAVRRAIQAEREQVREYYRQLYGNVGRRFASDTAGRLGEPPRPPEQSFAEEIDGWIAGAAAAGLIAALLSTATSDVISVVRGGIGDGESIQQIAARVEEQMEEVNARRALTIARTEVPAAASKGSMHGARIIGSPVQKEWVDSDDNRVRLSHRRIDGTSVPLGTLYRWFSPNSGRQVEAMYPHDPRLPINDRAGCRCIQFYSLI